MWEVANNDCINNGILVLGRSTNLHCPYWRKACFEFLIKNFIKIGEDLIIQSSTWWRLLTARDLKLHQHGSLCFCIFRGTLRLGTQSPLSILKIKKFLIFSQILAKSEMILLHNNRTPIFLFWKICRTWNMIIIEEDLTIWSCTWWRLVIARKMPWILLLSLIIHRIVFIFFFVSL